jgi:hypothetical protein
MVLQTVLVLEKNSYSVRKISHGVRRNGSSCQKKNDGVRKHGGQGPRAPESRL